MTIKIQKTPEAAMVAIPLEARESVVEWLRSSAASAALTAAQHHALARESGDKTTRGMARYWASIDAACRLLASRLAKSKRTAPRSRKADRRVDPE